MSSNNSLILPWQQKIWDELFCEFLRNNKLPQALLITGMEGLGKLRLATSFAQLVLCQQPESNLPCNSCQSCTLFETGHPDYILLPATDEESIKIEEIRELTKFTSISPHYSNKKTVVINIKDPLSTVCSNALLKTLEEPVADTLFILIAVNKQQLLPTIVSRTQAVFLQAPSELQAIEWLQNYNDLNGLTRKEIELALHAANYSPMRAKSLLDSQLWQNRSRLLELLVSGQVPDFKSMGEFAKIFLLEPKETLYLLYYLLTELIRCNLTQSVNATIDDVIVKNWQLIQNNTATQSLFSNLQVVTDAIKTVTTISGINTQLLLESTMLKMEMQHDSSRARS